MNSMKDLIPTSYTLLYSDKPFPFTSELNYSAKFKSYNANIRLSKNHLILNLSKKWKSVSPEIQIGLIQELMVKLFKKRVQTVNMDLYSYFMKNLPITITNKKSHPVLEASFVRVNNVFFDGFLDLPSFDLCNSSRKLGCYEYGTDTIVITKHLLHDQEALDYVMYHEMLHKKLKFKGSCGRHHYHTKEFKQMESKFPNAEQIEKRLSRIAVKNKVSSFFSFFR